MSTKIRVNFFFVVSSPLLNVVRRNSAAVFLSSSVLAQRRPGSTCRGAQHARRALTTSPLRRPLLDIAQSARSISQGQTTEIGLFFLPSREYNKALPRFLTELSRSEAPQSTTFLIVSWRKFFFEKSTSSPSVTWIVRALSNQSILSLISHIHDINYRWAPTKLTDNKSTKSKSQLALLTFILKKTFCCDCI